MFCNTKKDEGGGGSSTFTYKIIDLKINNAKNKYFYVAVFNKKLRYLA